MAPIYVPITMWDLSFPVKSLLQELLVQYRKEGLDTIVNNKFRGMS